MLYIQFTILTAHSPPLSGDLIACFSQTRRLELRKRKQLGQGDSEEALRLEPPGSALIAGIACVAENVGSGGSNLSISSLCDLGQAVVRGFSH